MIGTACTQESERVEDQILATSSGMSRNGWEGMRFDELPHCARDAH